MRRIAMKKPDCNHCRGVSRTRRDFLRAGTLSFLGNGLSDFLRFDRAQALAPVESAAAPQAKAQAVILVWLEGGRSHLDSRDEQGNSRFRPITTNAPEVQIGEIRPNHH